MYNNQHHYRFDSSFKIQGNTKTNFSTTATTILMIFRHFIAHLWWYIYVCVCDVIRSLLSFLILMQMAGYCSISHKHHQRITKKTNSQSHAMKRFKQWWWSEHCSHKGQRIWKKQHTHTTYLYRNINMNIHMDLLKRYDLEIKKKIVDPQNTLWKV